MARVPLPEVPELLIEYLQNGVYPRTGGLIKFPDGSWENPLDAAMRRGRQDVINYLVYLREIQTHPDTDAETRESLSVEVDSEGRTVFGEDSHVLRPTR